MISRRGLLAGILAAGVAPAIVRNPMKIWVPREPDESWGFSLIANNQDLQHIANAMARQMHDAMELACAPRIVVDPGFPGGDMTALLRYSLKRGQFTVISSLDMYEPPSLRCL